MKRLVMVLLLMLGAGIVLATEPLNEISVGIGGAVTSSNQQGGSPVISGNILQTGEKVNSIPFSNGQGSTSFNGKIIHYLQGNPDLGFGMDIGGMGFSDNGQVTTSYQQNLNLGYGLSIQRNENDVLSYNEKVGILPVLFTLQLRTVRENWEPYVFGGVGFSRNTVKVDGLVDNYSGTLTLQPYGAWASYSGTTLYTGSMYDDTTTSLALSGGVGMNYLLTSNLFLGVEGRLLYIGSSHVDPTNTGASLGFQTMQVGDFVQFGALVRLGIRF